MQKKRNEINYFYSIGPFAKNNLINYLYLIGPSAKKKKK